MNQSQQSSAAAHSAQSDITQVKPRLSLSAQQKNVKNTKVQRAAEIKLPAGKLAALSFGSVGR